LEHWERNEVQLLPHSVIRSRRHVACCLGVAATIESLRTMAEFTNLERVITLRDESPVISKMQYLSIAKKSGLRDHT
jgi:hypothetical protein